MDSANNQCSDSPEAIATTFVDVVGEQRRGVFARNPQKPIANSCICTISRPGLCTVWLDPHLEIPCAAGIEMRQRGVRRPHFGARGSCSAVALFVRAFAVISQIHANHVPFFPSR